MWSFLCVSQIGLRRTSLYSCWSIDMFDFNPIWTFTHTHNSSFSTILQKNLKWHDATPLYLPTFLDSASLNQVYQFFFTPIAQPRSFPQVEIEKTEWVKMKRGCELPYFIALDVWRHDCYQEGVRKFQNNGRVDGLLDLSRIRSKIILNVSWFEEDSGKRVLFSRAGEARQFDFFFLLHALYFAHLSSI